MTKQNSGVPDALATDYRLNRADGLFIFAIVLAIGAAFAPVVRNGFVDIDDPINLLENPHIRRLGLQEIRWMFSSFLTGPYQPLAWISLALDYQLWGLDARGFHLTSVVWHVSTAVVWYFVSRRLLHAAIPSAAESPRLLEGAAAVSALLFAIHPLRVESVAWATERRDVLSGFFAVCTIATYLRAVAEPRSEAAKRSSYFSSIALYVTSLLSKSSTVPIPLVLMLIDVWPLRRVPAQPSRWFNAESRRVWFEKWPYWAASMIDAVIAIYGQSIARTVVPPGTITSIDRIGLSCYSLLFYVAKTFIPIQLSPLYELRLPIAQWHVAFLWSFVSVALITIVALAVRRRVPGLLAGWICFAALVAPVSGLVKCGVQRAADRYTYLPSLSLSLLIAGVGLWTVSPPRGSTTRRLAAVGLSLACLGTLGVLTSKQCAVWRDAESFWTRVVQLDPRSSYGLAGLGQAYAKAGRLAEANELLHRSIELGTPLALPHYYLADVWLRMGKLEEAIECLHESMVRDPNFADSWYLLGQYWERRSDSAAAIAAYQRCLQIEPEHWRALARLEALRGQR